MIDWLTTHAGLIGLLVFFIFFTGVTIWTYRPTMRQKYRSYAAMALKDDEHE